MNFIDNETLLSSVPCQAVPPKAISAQTRMSSTNSVPATENPLTQVSFGKTVQHKSTAVNVTDDSAEGNSMDKDNQTIVETLISPMKTCCHNCRSDANIQ